MRGIRKIAALLVVSILLAAGCDGDGSDEGVTRAEFDAYESRVNPYLREEESVRNRFNESFVAAQSLGSEDDLPDLVRDVVLPAYERLAREVETVRPEGGVLRAIHLRLENYLSGRVRLFKVYLEWARQGTVPKRELTRDMNAVTEGRKTVTEKVGKIDELVRAAQREGDTDLVAKMRTLLKDDPVMAISPGFFQVVGVWLAGGISDIPGFVRALDEKVDPYYARLAKAIQEAATANAGNERALEAIAAARAYLREMLPCLQSIRALLTTHEKHERFLTEVVGPLRQQFEAGLDNTDEDLLRYHEAARDYRASL